MIAKGGYVYIVSNKTRTTLYIGVTSNLYNRIYEHKNGLGSVFTKKYNCTDLLYFEFHDDIESAITKEKQMKKWKRKYKENVINGMNPKWMDMFNNIEIANNEIPEFRFATSGMTSLIFITHELMPFTININFPNLSVCPNPAS